MRTATLIRFIVGLAFSTSLFTACSANGSNAISPVAVTSDAQHGALPFGAGQPFAGPPPSPGVQTSIVTMSPWLKHLNSYIPRNIALLYVSGATCSCVLIYSQRGHDQAPIGMFSGIINPRGLFVAREGETYIANSNAHVVEIFEEAVTKAPVETLTGTVHPSDVAREGNHGTIYVVNQNDINGGPGNISVYAPGSTIPTSYLYTHPNTFIDSVALDEKYNIFVGYGDPNGVAQIDEFKHGSTNPIQLPTMLGYTGGMEVDDTHDLLVADPDFFNGQNKPAADILSIGRRIPEFQFDELGWPYYVALNKIEHHVYISDAKLSQIREYTYPGGVLLDTITKGLENGNYPIGVAVAHPGQP
jgi:hypothetical protein